MGDVPSHYFRQAAAVPYRLDKDGVSIALVTAGKGRRWIVPKGVIDPGLTAAEAAAQEAYEEAGVRGEIDEPSLGTFEYEKWGGTCSVIVFGLRVDEVLDQWPESDRRRRRWLPADAAAEAVDRPEVARMIRDLASR